MLNKSQLNQNQQEPKSELSMMDEKHVDYLEQGKDESKKTENTPLLKNIGQRDQFFETRNFSQSDYNQNGLYQNRTL